MSARCDDIEPHDPHGDCDGLALVAGDALLDHIVNGTTSLGNHPAGGSNHEREADPMTAPLLATRDALADVIEAETGRHVWEPFGCVCSCGVVPPVVGNMHQVERHVAEAVADALAGVVRDPATLADDAARRVEREIRHLRAVPADVTTVPRDAMAADLEVAAQDIRALAAALSEDPA